jgi:hypothetical protein
MSAQAVCQAVRLTFTASNKWRPKRLILGGMMASRGSSDSAPWTKPLEGDREWLCRLVFDKMEEASTPKREPSWRRVVRKVLDRCATGGGRRDQARRAGWFRDSKDLRLVESAA